jgi:hypothetical protein
LISIKFCVLRFAFCFSSRRNILSIIRIEHFQPLKIVHIFLFLVRLVLHGYLRRSCYLFSDEISSLRFHIISTVCCTVLNGLIVIVWQNYNLPFCFVSVLFDQTKHKTQSKRTIIILQKDFNSFLHFNIHRSCFSFRLLTSSHSYSSNPDGKNDKLFPLVFSSSFSSFSKFFSDFLISTVEKSFVYCFFAFLSALGWAIFLFFTILGAVLDLTEMVLHNRERKNNLGNTVCRRGFQWCKNFLNVMFFTSFIRPVTGFSCNTWVAEKSLILSSGKYSIKGPVDRMSCLTDKWGKSYSRENLFYAVQMDKNNEDSDFGVFPTKRLLYPDLKAVISRGNSSWIVNIFSVLERRLSPRTKKQKKQEKDILNDKNEKDPVVSTQSKEEKMKEKENMTDFSQKNTFIDEGEKNLDQYTPKPQSPQKEFKTSLSHTKQPPLISFHTAGNWKDKKKSWGKYKKNTGWRDPYRDGEDFHGFHPWRYFAEMFAGKKHKKSDTTSIISSSESLKNKKSIKNASTDLHINMNTVMDENMDLGVHADIMQDGVLGSIKSESGILYIRNTETPPEYYTSENENGEEKNDPESSVERELYRSIRDYAHPRKPKF